MTYIYVCVYTTQWRKNSPFQEIVLEQLESIYKNRLSTHTLNRIQKITQSYKYVSENIGEKS